MKAKIIIAILPVSLLLTITGCINVPGNVAVPSTEITGFIGGKPVKIILPKDGSVEDFNMHATANGDVDVKIHNLNAKNNPDTVNGSYAGQIGLVDAGARAFKSGVESVSGAAGIVAGKALKESFTPSLHP